MKNASKTMLSVLLSIVIAFQSLPIYAIAAGRGNAAESEGTAPVENAVLKSENSIESLPYILGELTEERTENMKVFRMSDGSYTAAVYPVQIHFEKDGEMLEIDNSLEEVTVDSVELYRTKEGPVEISFPREFDGETPVTYAVGENSVSFILEGTENVEAQYGEKRAQGESADKIAALSEAISASVLSAETFEANFQKSAEDAEKLETTLSEAVRSLSDMYMSVEGAVSDIGYPMAMDDINVQYNISGTTLKENIIIEKRSAATKALSFTVKAEGLVPVLGEDGSVVLFDGDSTAVITIASPYMYDKIGAMSSDIDVSLTENEDGTYTYMLTPDKAWMLSAERVYPVTVDPPVEKSNIDTVKDTTGIFASAAGNLSNAGEKVYLKVGNRYDTSTGLTSEVQAMLYNDMSDIVGETASIVSASLNLYSFRGNFSSSSRDMQINAYMITEDWNTSDIDENEVLCLGSNGRADYSNVLDYVYYNDVSADGVAYSFDITEAAQKWSTGAAPNYGIALRASGIGNESLCARFYDSTHTAITNEDGEVVSCPAFVYVFRDQ
ncbi:MAG: DNRLRE domain-containing protein, partial [Ruminococcaceae bacterium]|nr:DNRLRE domain-containing protein [Oscillospiraceae bacterium]